MTIQTTSGIKVHAIRTGFVAVKPSHRTLRVFPPLRLPMILLDPGFTEWLPIYAWVIEHPEGTLVVDTGDTSRTAEPDYYNCDPSTKFIYNRILKMAVRPEDEIGAQLHGLGIDPRQVRWVVQTHMHSDHMGSLSTFRNAQVIVSSPSTTSLHRGRRSPAASPLGSSRSTLPMKKTGAVSGRVSP